MAKVILPGGVVIDGLSRAEATETAFEVARKLAKGGTAHPTPPARPVRPARTPHAKAAARRKPSLKLKHKSVEAPIAPAAQNGFDTVGSTLAFLEAIKDAGSNGLQGPAVQRILHADHPKGIGGRMVRINGFLRSLGFDGTEDLFDNPKDRKAGGRIWKPKRNLDAAIEAVRKAAAH